LYNMRGLNETVSEVSLNSNLAWFYFFLFNVFGFHLFIYFIL
jgi:hypothetical protein